MAYVDIVTALALLQFVYFGIQVGRARERFGVKAPAITGNDQFERSFRVQQNTLESIVVFLPSLYLFSRYFNPLWAAGLGVVYLIGDRCMPPLTSRIPPRGVWATGSPCCPYSPCSSAD